MASRLPRNLELRGGIYYVRVMIGGVRQRRSTGHTTLKSAIRKADEIKVQLRNDRDFRKFEAPFFSEWLKTYFETYSVRKRSPWSDKNALRHAARFFGRYRLDEITTTMCVRYLNKRLSEKAAKATVNLERAILGAVFQRALDDGLIEKNPWRKTERQPVGPRIRLLDQENEKHLRGKLSPSQNRWLTFMLGTGLRLAEARAVSENEIDFERRLIHVPAEAAKGGKSRDVPLFPEVEKVVREELAESEKLWHAAPQVYQHMLKIRAEDAAIPHLSPHDLRHTFATRYLRGGGNIFTLSKILGHASVTVTEKQYVHLIPTDLVHLSQHVDLGIAV